MPCQRHGQCEFRAMLAWLPSFMVRLRGLDTATTGALLGTYKGLVGVAGSIAGGLIVTGLMRFDQRWLAWAPMLFCLASYPPNCCCCSPIRQAGGMSVWPPTRC
jgi:hypothetical protein